MLSIGTVALLAGLAVFFGAYAVAAPIHDLPQDDYEDDPYLGDQVPADPKKGGLFDRLIRPTLRNFMPQTPMAAQIKARNNSKIAELLVRSGNPWNIQPEEFVGLRILAALVGMVTGLLLSIGAVLPSDLGLGVPLGPPVWMVVFAGLGYAVPKVLLDSQKGKRRKAAQKGLPEALDLMVITLNAGQNFQPALAEVVQRLPQGIVRDELGRVAADLRAGKGLERSLLDFARRAPSDEVESFCKAVVQSERLGADVAATLKSQSEAARQSYEADLDKRIGKLSTTLFFPILGFMLPALFVSILAPAMASISTAFG